MMLLAIIVLVLAAFTTFWLIGRRIEPRGDGQQENAAEARSNRYG